jgi:hypothetical protein
MGEFFFILIIIYPFSFIFFSLKKLSPCYLAASVGWLPGLQKLIQAGGDLMSARGGGSMKKTALHAAAENSHLSVAEYIVNMTQGVLNLETDSEGNNKKNMTFYFNVREQNN